MTRKTAKASTPPANGEQDPADVIRTEVEYKSFQSEEVSHTDLGLGDDQLLDMYRNMLLQRRFEERAAQMYGKQKISGFLHLYIGQEAVSTGVAHAMKIGEDSVITAYRDHGIALAMGMTSNECMAELFGKVDGCSKGKGGSMHFFSAEKRLFGGHGIVGGHIPVGVGIAFAHKYKEDGGVCICFFGDGAINQGSFHEAANLASLYKLPVVLVVERVGRDGPVQAGYRLQHARRSRRRNGCLRLLSCVLGSHRNGARQSAVAARGQDVSLPKKNADPIIRLKAYLVGHNLATNESLDVIDEDVKREVKASVEFAEKSPQPPLESIYEDVYAQKDYPFLK
jgi:pyruvate dehydrogenase E1 component alpha subunit